MRIKNRREITSPDPLELPSVGNTICAFLKDFNAYGRRGVFTAACLVAIGAVFEALSLVMLIPLIGLAIGSNSPSGSIGQVVKAIERFFGLQSSHSRLALLLGIFSLLLIMRAVVISLRDVKVMTLEIGFAEALRLRFAQSLVSAQWDQIARLRHARIAQLMNGDIQSISVMTRNFLRLTGMCTMLSAQAVLVIFLAPLFAISSLALLCIGVALFTPVVRRAHRLGRVVTDANVTLLDLTLQFLGGLKLALSQNLQGRFMDEFRRSLDELTVRQMDYLRQQSRVSVLMTTLPALAAALLVLLGFNAFQLAPATLFAIVVIIARMISPIEWIQQNVQHFIHTLPVYAKAKALERELSTIRHQLSRADNPPLPHGRIKLDGVTFHHASNEPGKGNSGVEDITLALEPGEIVGITGPSGAGKTTFVDLLVGLYTPQRGQITVGGAALDDNNVVSWREEISYVAQDSFLLHDTVRRNLDWATPFSREEDMWSALALAGADELVRRLEHGLDTVVGERGTLLSGGERQRIAIARALLRRPRLLVLDEATSAIDILGERSILKNLVNMRPRPTIVIVAHRLESLDLCDRVIRFEAGQCT